MKRSYIFVRPAKVHEMRNQVSVALDIEMIAHIDQEAHRCGMPRSHLIESILKRHVGNSNIENELATLSRRMANVALGYAQTRTKS